MSSTVLGLEKLKIIDKSGVSISLFCLIVRIRRPLPANICIWHGARHFHAHGLGIARAPESYPREASPSVSILKITSPFFRLWLDFSADSRTRPEVSGKSLV